MKSGLIVNVGAARLASIVLAGFFVLAVVAYFPPSIFGKFSLALSIIQICCGAALNWPNQAFLRFAREEYRATGSLSVALGARLVLHFTLLIVIVSFIVINTEYLSANLGLDVGFFHFYLPLALFLVPLPDISLVCAQSCGRFLAYGWSPLLQRAAQLIAIIAVLLGAQPTWQLLLVTSFVGYALSAVFAWMDTPRTVLKPRFAYSEVMRILRYAKTLPFATLGAYLIQWMDLWFIRGYLDDVSVGNYAWAYTFTLLVTSMLVPLAAVISPRAIDFELDRAHGGLIDMMKKIFSTCLLSGALLPIFIGVTGQFLINIMPINYVMSWPVILVLSAAIICQMGVAFSEPIVYAQEKLVARMTTIVVVMVCVKAAVNFLLVKRYGITGSAIATVICYGVGMVLQWRMLREALGTVVPTALPIFCYAIFIMVFSLFVIEHREWSVLSGTLITLLSLFFMRQLRLLSELPQFTENYLGKRIFCWLVSP